MQNDRRWTNGAMVVALLWCGAAARADDWPTYRHDAARSGITAEKVAVPLAQSWVFRAAQAPKPAWGDPKPEPVENILELRRVHFDDVFQPVAAGDAVFFGSSANNKVYCLDAATGQIRWTTITGGPVRLAPMVVDGRVYVGSDDGYAYCLDAADGSVVWKVCGAPEDRRVLGHGKMISLWPLRTGVLVDGKTAHFSAGIFPAEGVFLYAVDASDGREIWRNGSGGEQPQSRIAPQGYLLASATNLYVPMGRVSPAAFDRKTGRLSAASPFFGKTVGGTYALLAGKDIYTGTEEVVGYRSGSRDRFATFAGRKMVVTEETAYLASNTQLKAVDRKDSKTVRWTTPCPCADSLILAGDVLFAGGAGQVTAVDAKTGKALWNAEVAGTAKGLAAAGGRLLVSTDKGMIYSFAAKGSAIHGSVSEPVDKDPFAGSPHAAVFREAAEAVLKETGIRRGYCLVAGVETGQLALELAKRSELMIYAVSPDAKKVAAARKTLDAAGVYGDRVCVEQWPLDKVPYADYFANLIVSETALVADAPAARDAVPPAARDAVDINEISRMLKPHGGRIVIGDPSRRVKRPQQDGPRENGGSAGVIGGFQATRGALPGAGSWTHQYGEPGNTACGDDTLIKAPLRVLWFGQPGPGSMVNRHARAAGPLSLDGRMFVQGENVVMAYDAYNGLELWRREIPGAMRTTASHDTSNLVLGRDGLFVAVGDKCLRLDPATGKTMATYPLPPATHDRPRRWGYIARVGDMLLGSAGTRSVNSECLFAIDVKTGRHRWVHRAKQISNNSIAAGDGSVFLVSTDPTDQQRETILSPQRQQIEKLPEPQRAKALAELAATDVRLVTALDVQTGNVRWQEPVDADNCGGFHAGHKKDGAILAAMYRDGVLVLFGVYLDGHYWQQFFAGEFDSRRVIALSGDDGKSLWAREIGFRVRPLIVDKTLYAEPWAFDLHTGKQQTRVHPVTGQTDPWQFARPGHHCGLPIASPNCLFFRSWNLGYYDLNGDYGTMHFGAHRPGCWINFIPAGGLLMVPEASAGCMCAFPNVCTVVFQPAEKNKAWAYYSAPGSMTPVKRLALNFGAPGDRNDAAGNLWLGYPRPGGSLVLQFKASESFHPGGRFVTDNSNYASVAGTESLAAGGTVDPWLFASAAIGLQKCTIPLLDKADGTAVYDVRLAFADPVHDRPGQRVFDIKLQGKVVHKAYDVAAAAGGRNRAVFARFDGIEVDGALTIELLPKAGMSDADQLPILQGVEIVRRRVLTLGCTMPDLLLSSLQPKQSVELKLTNLRDETATGTLKLIAPKGFEISPKEMKLTLAAGQRKTVPVVTTVKDLDTPAGDYAVGIRIVRSDDGSVELQQAVRIEHLGRRGRVVLHPVEDTYVHGRYPDRNRGTVDTLLIDGGQQKMGDSDHAAAYLKFRLDLPGKPISARLRIFNAGNPTGDSGRICLVDQPWAEKEMTYPNRPKPGKEIGRLGRVAERQVVECPLNVDLTGRNELSLMIDPTSCDGVTYVSREGGKPAELIVEYEP